MYLYSIVLIVLSSWQSAGQVIDNDQLQTLLKNDDVQLIDVRTPEEWSYGYIEGAEKIDYYDPAFIDKLGKLDKEKPLILYCAAGGRSAQAAAKLKAAGFEKIYDLGGGFRGWAAAGLPTVK